MSFANIAYNRTNIEYNRVQSLLCSPAPLLPRFSPPLPLLPEQEPHYCLLFKLRKYSHGNPMKYGKTMVEFWEFIVKNVCEPRLETYSMGWFCGNEERGCEPRIGGVHRIKKENLVKEQLVGKPDRKTILCYSTLYVSNSDINSELFMLGWWWSHR